MVFNGIYGSAIVSSHTYVYNSDGRKTSETTADGSAVSYTYDDAGQLTAESKVNSSSATLYSLTYTYDAAGNRASKYDGSTTESYTYDDANKLQSAGVKSYTYDDAGNTTSVYNSVSGITTSLTWDAEERMTGVSNDASTGAISDTYTYNGLDQRVAKGGSGGGQVYTRAGDAIDAPVLQDWMATYNYGAGNELISEVHDLSPTPQSRFYMSDALGTTRAVRDDTGTLRDVLDCDAFGNALSSTMGNTQPPFGFGGKAGYQTDLDTGLMLLGHRFYDSSTGRFLSRDPIQDGYNWYTYCDDDPVNGIDPEGLDDANKPPTTPHIPTTFPYGPYTIGNGGGGEITTPLQPGSPFIIHLPIDKIFEYPIKDIQKITITITPITVKVFPDVTITLDPGVTIFPNKPDPFADFKPKWKIEVKTTVIKF